MICKKDKCIALFEDMCSFPTTRVNFVAPAAMTDGNSFIKVSSQDKLSNLWIFVYQGEIQYVSIVLICMVLFCTSSSYAQGHLYLLLLLLLTTQLCIISFVMRVSCSTLHSQTNEKVTGTRTKCTYFHDHLLFLSPKQAQGTKETLQLFLTAADQAVPGLLQEQQQMFLHQLNQNVMLNPLVWRNTLGLHL